MPKIKIDYSNKYIGDKQIKDISETEDKILSVEYQNGTKERYSSLLIDLVISDEPCDATELRNKRIQPIVQEVLKVLRDWGLKLNELGSISILLNQSIDFNHAQALNYLWSKYVDKPLSPEDIDMWTVDKVLKDAGKE